MAGRLLLAFVRELTDGCGPTLLVLVAGMLLDIPVALVLRAHRR
jgi:hypothetical protein